MLLVLIFLATIVFLFYHFYPKYFPAPNIDTKDKYVLISGCDSGFGNLLAHELDRQQFRVFAGVLSERSLEELRKSLSSNATVFRLDVTKPEDIDQAFELVSSKTKVLHGLVNNAGIAISGNIEWTSMENLRKVMNVNFFGHVQMTKTFLPLLIAKKDSRVVNICSVAGYLATPGLSAYCASKFALESFSDCLRREMAPWNLRVSIIEPGFMRTPIIQGRAKSFEDFSSQISSDVQERWGVTYLRELYESSGVSVFIKKAEDPMKVVRALEHAVSNTKPQIRYRPGIQSSLIFFPISMLPACFTDWLLQKLASRKTLPAGVANQKEL